MNDNELKKTKIKSTRQKQCQIAKSLCIGKIFHREFFNILILLDCNNINERTHDYHNAWYCSNRKDINVQTIGNQILDKQIYKFI